MNKFLILIVAACLLFTHGIQAKEDLPYKNPLLPVEVRVDDLLARMTLEEKIAQIRHLHSWDLFDGQTLNMKKLHNICAGVGYGFFEGFPLTASSCRDNFRKIQTYLVENTRLGIPGFVVAESLHGVVQEGCTIYPQNIAMGSTFNIDLAYEKAKHIAGELNEIGVKQVLAPCVDVVRDLRWGRVEESFAEDPFICSMMALAEVQGYMSHGISPMLKHYGPHGNPQGGLNLASVDCGTRDLFDIYMKPFETVVTHTNIMAVMSSYNSWNRVPNSTSHFMLTEILRNKWGFRGYVYSDWGVVEMLKTFHKTAVDDLEAAGQVLSAGLDVEASSYCFSVLEEKVRSGDFDVFYIDRAVRRVLRAKFEMGLFEDPYLEHAPYRLPLHSDESVSLSRKIADESVVLLKNEKQLLPLDTDKLKSIAVIGPNADCVQFGDYTWSRDNKDGITPLQGIRHLVGDRIQVNYSKGCSLTSLDRSGIEEAVFAAQQSDVAVVFVGSSSAAFVRYNAESPTSGEGVDLSDISLTGVQNELVQAVYATGKPVIVVLVAGKPFAIPWIKEHVSSVLVQWYAGEQGGASIADILFGNVNPSGKLTFSFPQSTGHLPVYYNHLSTDKGFYKEPGSYDKPGRDYVFSSPAPLWAFGYGLSYTDFKYKKAYTDKKHYQLYDTISVVTQIENVGNCRGKEVVQAYVHDVVSTVMTPVKQLKGFAKVELGIGESKDVLIQIPVKELYQTDDSGNRFLEEGEFEIQIGTSSDRISFKLPIYVGKKVPVGYQTNETVVRKKDIGGHLIQVKGVVRDIQATPIVNVRITSNVMKSSVQTDLKGEYSILVPENSSLIFSKDGYVTKEVEVEWQGDLNVQMCKGG